MNNQTDLEYIASQTNMSDLLEVEKMFYKNNCNTADTIIDILKLQITPNEQLRKDRVKTKIDDIREILDLKETAYIKHVNENIIT